MNRYSEQAGDAYLMQRSTSKTDSVQHLRSTVFSDLPLEGLVVLDFGCGTGGILAHLPAAEKLGVEIGPAAAAMATANGLRVFDSLDNIASESIDAAISFHAIEHVDAPLEVLRGIFKALRPGGFVRLVVPCELPISSYFRSWRPNSDRHLYTWTPLHFGNLAEAAGFTSIATRIAPMPTNSRLVKYTRLLPIVPHALHSFISFRRNNFNTIIDARKT